MARINRVPPLLEKPVIATKTYCSERWIQRVDIDTFSREFTAMAEKLELRTPFRVRGDVVARLNMIQELIKASTVPPLSLERDVQQKIFEQLCLIISGGSANDADPMTARALKPLVLHHYLKKVGLIKDTRKSAGHSDGRDSGKPAKNRSNQEDRRRPVGAHEVKSPYCFLTVEAILEYWEIERKDPKTVNDPTATCLNSDCHAPAYGHPSCMYYFALASLRCLLRVRGR